jgi:hypothetical protein
VLDLVPRQPEPVRRLQVVARRRLALAGRAPGEEVGAEVPDRRRRRQQGGDDREADGQA